MDTKPKIVVNSFEEFKALKVLDKLAVIHRIYSRDIVEAISKDETMQGCVRKAAAQRLNKPRVKLV